MSTAKHVVNIRGKDYLTVAGRVALAHETGRLLGVQMQIAEDGGFARGSYAEGELESQQGFVTVKASVKVLNEANIPLVEKLIKTLPKESTSSWQIESLINRLLINEYEGLAKSPREGSAAWQKLPANAPERSNPTEVCATSALGRALGAAGFGDTESFASADEISVAQNRQANSDAPASSASSAPRQASDTKGPTDKQKKFLQTLVKQKLGVSSPEQFASLVQDKFGKPMADLSSRDVSNWIDELAKEEVPF